MSQNILLVGEDILMRITWAIFCHSGNLDLLVLEKVHNVISQPLSRSGYSQKCATLHEQSNILFHVSWKKTGRSCLWSNFSPVLPFNSEKRRKLILVLAWETDKQTITCFTVNSGNKWTLCESQLFISCTIWPSCSSHTLSTMLKLVHEYCPWHRGTWILY